MSTGRPSDDEGAQIALLTVDEFWNSRWHGPTAFAVLGSFLIPDPRPYIVPPGRHIHVAGTAFVGLADHHVHLGLVDPTLLQPGGITDVDDLGWIPDVTQTWATGHSTPGWPYVTTSGGFITVPGGYPALSGWAPRAAAVEVSTPEEAEQAVHRQHEREARQIKVTLNSRAGPVLDDELLATVAMTAHQLGMPVVAHAEGAGQAERAWRAGIGILAHTPFSERLDDDLVRAMATRMSWISTFDIHGWGAPTPEYDIAIDNARRFVAAGGRMLYGTDLGNGPLPVGLNVRELRALASVGLSRDALIASIATIHAGVGGLDAGVPEEFVDAIPSRFVVVSGTPPATAEETADWLASARIVETGTMTEEDLR
jgi:Imidazolonepropionase and related amidohydrolases